MTLGESIRHGHAGGYVLRVEKTEGLETYLADYRRKSGLTTPYPAAAEWFRYHRDAREMAERASFLTGFRFVATTAPKNATPQPIEPTLADLMPPYRDLTPDQERQMAFQQAVRDFLLEDESPLGLLAVAEAVTAIREDDDLDDEDSDVIAASLGYPGARTRGALAPEEMS